MGKQGTPDSFGRGRGEYPRSGRRASSVSSVCVVSCRAARGPGRRQYLLSLTQLVAQSDIYTSRVRLLPAPPSGGFMGIVRDARSENRERERERPVAILAQVLHHPLVRGARQRVDLGCAPGGALLPCPVVLEHISAAVVLKLKPRVLSSLSPEPERGPSSEGGPLVGGRGILCDRGPVSDPSRLRQPGGDRWRALQKSL